MGKEVEGFDRGLTPVIGGVLLIVIVILLSFVTAAMIFEMVETPEEMPVTRSNYEWEMDKGKFSLTHEAGDSLEMENIYLRGPGEMNYSDDTFSAGDSVPIDIHEPGGEFKLIWSRGQKSLVLTTEDNPITSNLDFPPTITIGYEDLPFDGSSENDYDYNDWIVKLETQVTGFIAKDQQYAQEIKIEFEPQARLAGYSHDQYIVPENLGTGTYTLTVYDDSGNVVKSEKNSYTATDEIKILDSGNVLNYKSQCNPERTAKLVLEPDNPARIPDNPINETHQHGSALPFNPRMKPSGNNEVIGIGDSRMLTVQAGWKWPDDSVHIAEVYNQVGPASPSDGDKPTFKNRTWFENPDPSSNLNTCG